MVTIFDNLSISLDSILEKKERLEIVTALCAEMLDDLYNNFSDYQVLRREQKRLIYELSGISV